MKHTTSDYAKIIAKAWGDPGYEKRLIADPGTVLKEEGWELDPSTTIQIKPGSENHTIILGLPKKPEGLSDQHLREASERAAHNSFCADPCCC